MMIEELRNPPHLSVSSIQKYIANEWTCYSAGKTYENLLSLGKGLPETFYRQLHAKKFIAVAIEEPFQFQIDGLDIPSIGGMDLVEEDDVDGSIVITEYKTAAKTYGLDEVSDIDYVYLANLLVYVDRENPKQVDWVCVRIG